ncbi:hypothetical protein AVEN_150970-1 [Araneus ventricosus]|uniref:Uncharacterized protein n=1 Tax=Araneus ventricosus TaxID=182803 RepID=A0A4Y2X3B5_ARAVE|nr:hypothetical protein AVEN_1270-1 [Araneus ventricosus]GBO44001.1 hypothetical protein AVEN_145266-1 [Araneus ventricosus]GBO44003.1 hypothetical protein AVEN_148156-1 [Araneus ventricosus]GBO44005.1 hypothetical protein AVEN_150970-1 [Araneus ventricosus]
MLAQTTSDHGSYLLGISQNSPQNETTYDAVKNSEITDSQSPFVVDIQGLSNIVLDRNLKRLRIKLRSLLKE